MRKEEPTTPFESIERLSNPAPEVKEFPFSMGEVFSNLRNVRKLPASYFSKAEEIRDRSREFADLHIRPVAVEIDQKVSQDPHYFHWDTMKKACSYKLLSMMIPRAFGGGESSVLHMSMMVEELAVGCGGLASTIGVHSAGVSCGMLTLDPHILEYYIRPIADKEKEGVPIVWSGAVTEPQAGTDIWDEDFLHQARLMTFAEKRKDGYLINGRKCFISNGSVAHYSVITAALDRSNPADSWTVFLVPTDSPGFSVGRVERKMGQKGSPAAELVFEDVLIPKELKLGEEGTGGHLIQIYLAASRGPVGAIGTGIARRALECLIDWAKQKRISRGWLMDQQAMQITIARMAQEIELARQAYVNAAIAYDLFVENLLKHPGTRLALLFPGRWFKEGIGKSVVTAPFTRRIIGKILEKAIPDDRLAQASALATLAKVKGSEVGVKVAGEAARIMGHDAADPRWPVEKCFRDAKLTQIYEGTNQANTITFFKDMVRTWQER